MKKSNKIFFVLCIFFLILGMNHIYNSFNGQKSSNQGLNVSENLMTQGAKAEDSIPPCFWHNLKDINTPNGKIVKFEIKNDSTYTIKWGKEENLQILNKQFYCDAPAITKPNFVEEDENYIVMRFGCGTSCWGGIFLPIQEEESPETILYYYDYDLKNDLVAFLDSQAQTATISVLNLKTKQKYEYPIKPECESAIPTYCIDSISISNRELYYRWNPQTTVQSEELIERIITIE